MRFEGKVTTDRDLIRSWVEARAGWPAVVKKYRDSELVEDLRFGFPGCEIGEPLEAIPWDQFFERFDRQQLVFLYKEKTQPGDLSRSFNFL